MATLQKPASGFTVTEVPPEGTYVATIGRIDDYFNVERPKFNSPGETETTDMTRFTFGIITPDGRPFRVQTFEMRISGHEKSRLFDFLRGILGHDPAYGWDYCSLKGQGAIVTVAHKKTRDQSRTYAHVAAVRPVKDSLGDYSAQIPPLDRFVWEDEDVTSPPPPPTPAAPAPPAAPVAPRPPAVPPPLPTHSAAQPPGWSPTPETPCAF